MDYEVAFSTEGPGSISVLNCYDKTPQTRRLRHEIKIHFFILLFFLTDFLGEGLPVSSYGGKGRNTWASFIRPLTPFTRASLKPAPPSS